ncbi:MAG: amidohydrolase family protein [Acidobacteria bacterium]|nr:amidohydrolase family protein [Acidobacteriota bacterium]
MEKSYGREFRYCFFRIAPIFILFWASTAHGQPVPQQNPPAEVLAYADMVLYDGKIVTMDDKSVNPVPGTTVQAMAIRDGKILKLGESQDILRLAGPETQRVDLKGRTVIPGLIDTHSHLHEYSEHWSTPTGIRLSAAGGTSEELVKNIEAKLKDAVQKARPGEWIRIGIPSDDAYELIVRQQKYLRRNLDLLAPQNPVIISGGANQGLVNGKAIEAIEKYFKTPIGPIDMVDKESGIVQPVVEFTRSVSTMLFGNFPHRLAENIRNELEEWAAFGVTTFSSHIQVASQVDAYAELDRRGLMPIRFAWAHRSGTLFNMSNAAGFYTRLGNLAGTGSDHWWNIGVTTGYFDFGYPRLATSIQAKPEIKAREAHAGETGMIKPQVLSEMIRAGLRISGTHIQGDLALDSFLDAIEDGSKEAGFTQDEIQAKRHNVDHCGLSPRPDQYERLKRLGIIMSCGPKYIPSISPRALRDYGEKYLEWVSPMKSLIDSGVKTVWEIDDHNVAEKGAFYFLELAVTRKGDDGRVWAQSQRIDRTLALKTATSWAAEYVLRPEVLGSLEPGKWADFLVLNRDYFTVPEDSIRDVRPLMTVVGGKTIYLDPGLAAELGIKPVGIQPRFAK